MRASALGIACTLRLLLLLLTIVGVAPAHADPVAALRTLDRRVATVADRLLIANAPLCARTAADFGIALHAIDQYAPDARDAARAAFGFAAPVAIAAVAGGGAADLAGLRPDDALIAIGGVPVAAPAADAAATARTRDAAGRQLAALPPGTPTVLTLLRDGRVHAVTVVPAAGCAAQVSVSTGRGINAVADGDTILIGRALAERVRDSGLAAVIAHELAHIVLDHHAALKTAGVRHGLAGEVGRSRRLVRASEDAADRLSAWLLANAGIAVADAVAFWRHDAPAFDGGPFRSRTHAGVAARARLIESEMPALAAVSGHPARPPWLDTASIDTPPRENDRSPPAW